jgi:hypothetical protein
MSSQCYTNTTTNITTCNCDALYYGAICDYIDISSLGSMYLTFAIMFAVSSLYPAWRLFRVTLTRLKSMPGHGGHAHTLSISTTATCLSPQVAQWLPWSANAFGSKLWCLICILLMNVGGVPLSLTCNTYPLTPSCYSWQSMACTFGLLAAALVIRCILIGYAKVHPPYAMSLLA